MESLQHLKQLGTDLGYEGEELREFVRYQQESEREERRMKREEEREKEREKLEFEYKMKEMEMTKETKEHEIESLIEKERLIVRREEAEYKHKMELLETQGRLGVGIYESEHERHNHFESKGPKLPYFEEGKDDMDVYLQRFERYANAQQWSRDKWAMHLSALLKGKTLEVYSRLPPDQAFQYDVLKTALLRRFDLTSGDSKNGSVLVDLSLEKHLVSFQLDWKTMLVDGLSCQILSKHSKGC
ncbi:trichohyalin-like [Gigantopelta aegis]|uniref:trichohyalin-like n=1 Tax=Gigantopelta aegis TaxID=1735272 RepID=UPI001B888CBD|nr:trichohyalin-like [Gigantopelta aegis]